MIPVSFTAETRVRFPLGVPVLPRPADRLRVSLRPCPTSALASRREERSFGVGRGLTGRRKCARFWLLSRWVAQWLWRGPRSRLRAITKSELRHQPRAPIRQRRPNRHRRRLAIKRRPGGTFAPGLFVAPFAHRSPNTLTRELGVRYRRPYDPATLAARSLCIY